MKITYYTDFGSNEKKLTSGNARFKSVPYGMSATRAIHFLDPAKFIVIQCVRALLSMCG